MKILVTGGNGLVGMALQEYVNKITKECKNYNANEYIFLTRQNCDLTKYHETSIAFMLFKPDIVIHLASLVAGLYGNMSNNYEMFMENTIMHLNIIKCCKEFKIKRLINMLSTCVFPDGGVTYPLTSEQIMNGAPHNSNEGYAYSKRMLKLGSDLLVKSKDDFEVINIIPTNLYGKNDNYNLAKSHVIPGLIHKLYLAKQRHEPYFVVPGSGNAVRQFMYVEDLAKILHDCVDIMINGKSIDFIASVSIDYKITIKELVNKITKLIDYQGVILYDSTYPDGQMRKSTSSNELIVLFPEFEFTDINNGLEKTINYFINNYNTIRK